MDASHWNFFISQKHDTVYIRKKNNQQNFFYLKFYENCLKSDLSMQNTEISYKYTEE